LTSLEACEVNPRWLWLLANRWRPSDSPKEQKEKKRRKKDIKKLKEFKKIFKKLINFVSVS